MTLLRLVGVTKIFGSRTALREFSCEIEEGERVAIVGPSGCGKTTVLRLLAGFEIPDAGRVEIAGSVVAVDGTLIIPPENRNVGMVFQDLALWPHMTVVGNLEFGLQAKGLSKAERRERIREMLAAVELSEYADSRPTALSGGQQQRVALARALVLRPKALLMDEPLSSLDLDLNLKLREEILRLHEAYLFALVYVTHDPEEAAALAERTIQMRHGHQEDSPQV